MRPHKKRFLMELDHRDCRLNAINDANDKQDETLYMAEDNEKDKEKDGMPRGRKRWKRKISRKQFRHHDIKLFSPCDYKTSSMLKQKDPNSHQEAQKGEVNQKESITEPNAAEQKQQVPAENNVQKRLKVDEVNDGKTKTNLEENNNILTTENHNNMGKHNLPAIVMETPSANIRTTRNIWPKTLIDCYQKSNKTSTDCERPIQPAFEQGMLAAKPISDSSPSRELPVQSNENVPCYEPCVADKNVPPSTNYIPSYFQNSSENAQLNVQMDIVTHENDQPEDLSTQTPVDLSRKPFSSNVEKVPERNHILRKTAPSPNLRMNNIAEEQPPNSVAFISVNNSNHISKNSTPEVVTATAPSHPNKQWYYTDPFTINHVNHILSIFDEIRQILAKPFSNEMIGEIEYVYKELKKIKEDDKIPMRLKIEAQNLSSDVEKFVILRTIVNTTKEVDCYKPDQRRLAFRDIRLPEVPKYNHKRPSLEAVNMNRSDQNLAMFRSKSHKIEKMPKRYVRRTLSHPETIGDKTNVILSPPINRSSWNSLGFPLYQPKLSPPTHVLNLPPNAYSDMFYKNIQNYIANGNPLPVSVHPHLGTNHQRSKPNSQEISTVPHNEPQPAILSTTEREEVFPPTENVTVSPLKPPSPLPLCFKQQQLKQKSALPAVIVADNSMEITKEPNEVIGENYQICLAKNKSPTAEPKRNMVDALDDSNETNSEFEEWLRKLKSNEKLKKEFLSQMGINKESESDRKNKEIEKNKEDKEDTIEIVDSDDDEKIEPPIKPQKYEEPIKIVTKNELVQKPVEPAIITKYPEQSKPNSAKSLLPNKRSSNPAPLRKTVPSVEEIKLPSNLESRSVPMTEASSTSTADGHRYFAPLQSSEKITYSPQIEPISPVDNETSFVFTEVSQTKSDKMEGFFNNTSIQKNMTSFYTQLKNTGVKSLTECWKSIDRPQPPCSPRIAPHGKLCYIRDNHMFIRYFDDTQVALFNLSIQNDELVKANGMNPSNFGPYNNNKRHIENMNGTEIIKLPRDVEFSRKEDLREVEEFVKERTLVEKHVPKDFADFYIYVTGFQIVKMNPPVSLQTFLAMYNTNRTAELLKKYLQKIDENGPVSVVK